MYPWSALGAAAAVGCMIYTSGRQKATAVTASLADGTMAGEPVAGPGATGQEQRSWTGQNLLLSASGFLLPVAVAASQNYVLRWLEQFYPSRTVDRTGFSPSGGERSDRMDHA
jgi:hypothetical protein